MSSFGDPWVGVSMRFFMAPNVCQNNFTCSVKNNQLICVLVNLAEIQQGFQKTTLPVPAHDIWEGDGHWKSSFGWHSLRLITRVCCSMCEHMNWVS